MIVPAGATVLQKPDCIQMRIMQTYAKTHRLTGEGADVIVSAAPFYYMRNFVAVDNVTIYQGKTIERTAGFVAEFNSQTPYR